MDLHDRREYSVSIHGSAKDARVEELEALLNEYKDAEHRARKAEGEALTERNRLREALENIMRHQRLVAGEFGAKTTVYELARAALEGA